jgi:hypothetical protein
MLAGGLRFLVFSVNSGFLTTRGQRRRISVVENQPAVDQQSKECPVPHGP